MFAAASKVPLTPPHTAINPLHSAIHSLHTPTNPRPSAIRTLGRAETSHPPAPPTHSWPVIRLPDTNASAKQFGKGSDQALFIRGGGVFWTRPTHPTLDPPRTPSYKRSPATCTTTKQKGAPANSQTRLL